MVLTYAIAPDPNVEAEAVELTAPSIVCSTDPTHPTPSVLHFPHVAAHAVRHLVHLAESDPTIRAARLHSLPLWRAMARASMLMPVGLHEDAHRLAQTPRLVAVESLRAAEGTAGP